MSGRWTRTGSEVATTDDAEFPELESQNSNKTWATLAKCLIGIHAIGLLAVYGYSIYLGFSSGFFKGCFMLLIPVIAQIWLFFEEWMCNPCGFSSCYTTFMTCVLLVALLSGIAYRISELCEDKDGKDEKAGLLILFCAVVIFGGYRYIRTEKGASSPEDVACMYAIAASRFDIEIAKYYSGRGMQDWFDDIESAFKDRKNEQEQIQGSVRSATKGLSFRAEKQNEDPEAGNVRVVIEIIGHGDVLSVEHLTLERQYGEWKVVDGGKFGEQWKGVADRTRGLF